MPLLKAKQALRQSPSLSSVTVATDDASSVRDFGVFAEHAELELVCEHCEDYYQLTLREPQT